MPASSLATKNFLDYLISAKRMLSTIHGMWTRGEKPVMKSQDILLLFKMTSLHAQEENLFGRMELESTSEHVRNILNPEPRWLASVSGPVGEVLSQLLPNDEDTVFRPQELDSPMGDSDRWEGWSDVVPSTPVTSWSENYSLRALSASLGLSKSEVSNAMARCRNAGLLTSDFDTGLPKVNRRELLKVAEHALKYFFSSKARCNRPWHPYRLCCASPFEKPKKCWRTDTCLARPTGQRARPVNRAPLQDGARSGKNR